METFTSSFDTWSKAVTILIIGLVTGIAMTVYVKPSLANIGPRSAKIIVSIIFISPLVVYAYSIRYYGLDKDKLIIKRPLSFLNIEIPYSEIKNVTAVDPNLVKNSNRDFGDGGLFGYIGNFSSNSLGKFKLYATNFKSSVVIDLKTDGKRNRIILSPDDTSMVREIKKKILMSQVNI